MAATGDWGGDTPPSRPQALTRKKYLSFGGGFCMTDSGIAHDISAAEVEALAIPPFSPPPRMGT